MITLVYCLVTTPGQKMWYLAVTWVLPLESRNFFGRISGIVNLLWLMACWKTRRLVFQRTWKLSSPEKQFVKQRSWVCFQYPRKTIETSFCQSTVLHSFKKWFFGPWAGIRWFRKSSLCYKTKKLWIIIAAWCSILLRQSHAQNCASYDRRN